MAPGQFLLDPDPAQAAELAAPGFVVHEVGQGHRVVVDVVGPHVNAGVADRHARLPQVEGQHRQLERHVLHRLVHRRHVVERVLGVGRQAHVGGRHDPGHQLVGGPAGEFHVAAQVQLVPQRDQLGEAVARAHQGDADVLAVQLVDQDVGGQHHDVHPVLGPHHADVGGQVLPPAAQVRLGRSAAQPVGVGPGADHGHVGRRLAAAVDGDVAVGVVGRDDVVGGPVRGRSSARSPR